MKYEIVENENGEKTVNYYDEENNLLLIERYIDESQIKKEI